MSPSWRDRLLVGLSPERVAAVHLKRGLKPAVAADGVRDCAAADAAAPPWAAALASLEELLGAMAPLKGSARVVLSNQFVRYGTVPWTEGVLGEEDRKRLAAGWFQSLYGEVAGSWRIVLDRPRYGCDTLAAAVDEALVAAVRDALARHGLALASLWPHLAAAFDRWRGRLAADDGGFVVVEPGCVTSLFRRREGWAVVSNRRYRAEAPDGAAQLLRQCIEADAVQGGEGAVALLAPGAAPAERSMGGRPLRLLEGAAGPWPEDPWRSMAWSVA